MCVCECRVYAFGIVLAFEAQGIWCSGEQEGGEAGGSGPQRRPIFPQGAVAVTRGVPSVPDTLSVNSER